MTVTVELAAGAAIGRGTLVAVTETSSPSKSSLWPQQGLDGAALVHGQVALGGLGQREAEVEDLAQVDLPVDNTTSKGMSDGDDERRAETPVQVTQGGPMTDKQVGLSLAPGVEWGVDFAKAALAAGNAVVATGRNTDAVRTAVGEAEDLLVVQLDVTSPGGRRGRRQGGC